MGTSVVKKSMFDRALTIPKLKQKLLSNLSPLSIIHLVRTQNFPKK